MGEELIWDKTAAVGSDEELINQRKQKILNFLKTQYDWVAYFVLAVIVFLAVRIRTLNLNGLRDITTGTWTLGPDLDPFLFLRWAKNIVENGSLFAVDEMRYVPLGFETKRELLLHPYMIAWFHKYLGWTFGSESVTHSAVIYPVFFFAITVIAFFLLTRKIFADSMGERNANIIALIASFFLTVMPPLLPRTIAGIPEKESAAFFFMFMAFYLFLSAWKAKSLRNGIICGALAGAFTAGMALVWGGYAYIFLIISPVVFIEFLLGKVDKNKFFVYTVWIFSSFALMIPFSLKYSILRLLMSISAGPAVLIFILIGFHLFVFEPKLKKYFENGKFASVPPRVISTILVCVIMGILVSAIWGVSFIPARIDNILNNLVKPATSRLIQTVAENRQPYFTEWESNYGPHIHDIAIGFWLFFFGLIYLFSDMIREFSKKEKIVLVGSYVLFLLAIIFSRYGGESIFNGENFVSLFVYAMGFAVLTGSFGFYYYKHCKEKNEEIFKTIDSGIMLLFIFAFMSIVSARGAVRLIMTVAPPASIIIAYLAVKTFESARKKKGTGGNVLWIAAIFVIVLTIFSGYSYYSAVDGMAQSYVPSIYTQQWQKAMAWVRENTSENAVFGHWWDYGYWLQSIGKRATVLDGGNSISYWNHMMGRYALTGTDNAEALDFLYAHNTTHFLIDSTDIGKYGAFSSIGSDVNYDRVSYIPTFVKNTQATQEKKNSTVFVYQGGMTLDEDIIFETEQGKVFLAGGKAGIGAVAIEKDASGKIVGQPIGIFVYQNNQYPLPLRYAYDGKLVDFGSGIEDGVFLMPQLNGASDGSFNIDKDGALLYLSRRTVKSQLARLYLYNEDNPNFKLVHSEDDFLVAQIKSQNPDFNSDFVVYQGFRGPIKIWEINYPKEIEFKEEYLDANYPEEIRIAK